MILRRRQGDVLPRDHPALQELLRQTNQSIAPNEVITSVTDPIFGIVGAEAGCRFDAVQEVSIRPSVILKFGSCTQDVFAYVTWCRHGLIGIIDKA